MTEQNRGAYAARRHAAAVEKSGASMDEWPSVQEAERLKAVAADAKRAARDASTVSWTWTGRERAQAEREAKRLHDEMMLAHVAWGNAQLVVASEHFDRVLANTLEVDDHVDFEEFRRVADHPPFVSEHVTPTPQPAPLQAPPEPVFQPPVKPSGLAGMFGQKKYQEQWHTLRADFERRWMAWQSETALLPTKQLQQLQMHQAAEGERKARLERDRARYDQECELRQHEVARENRDLDELIARYRQGEASAVEECCSIVFESSVYPKEFEPHADFTYEQQNRELSISLQLPAPDDLPTTRAFKYVKARDEIDETALPLKEQRERYANLIYSITLRTLHELLEADRADHIEYVALVAGVDHVDPATGLETRTPLVAVAVRREDFEEINLARVTPGETLKHLNAVLSRNAHSLAAISVPDGVRG